MVIFNTSTALINKLARGEDEDEDSSSIGGCLGADIGPYIIKSAKKKLPHIPFEVGDGFKPVELVRMREK